jgi:hypothetical protein
MDSINISEKCLPSDKITLRARRRVRLNEQRAQTPHAAAKELQARIQERSDAMYSSRHVAADRLRDELAAITVDVEKIAKIARAVDSRESVERHLAWCIKRIERARLPMWNLRHQLSELFLDLNNLVGRAWVYVGENT